MNILPAEYFLLPAFNRFLIFLVHEINVSVILRPPDAETQQIVRRQTATRG